MMQGSMELKTPNDTAGQRRYSALRRSSAWMASRLGALVCMACVAALAACTTSPQASRPSAQVVSELAPSGTMRAAINVGNPVLATMNTATGQPEGISVDLARELAKRLGVPVSFVIYNAAGKVTAGVQAQQWDVGFVGIDPERAEYMDYTPPYVIIQGVYMVPQDSKINTNADVDRAGVRIAISGGSVYDLYLSRRIKNAQLVRAPAPSLVTDMMLTQHYEVAAGVKQRLAADVARLPGLRLLDGNFMVIRQAMATPRNRPEATRYLTQFVEEMKSSGFVAASLQRHHVDSAEVAPAETAPQ
ncbi:polar amino acid transport system substrate-binding protein [Paraburkholderia sp. GAS33]|jgi:polar amino acid transport system substrate-binding protein